MIALHANHWATDETPQATPRIASHQTIPVLAIVHGHMHVVAQLTADATVNADDSPLHVEEGPPRVTANQNAVGLDGRDFFFFIGDGKTRPKLATAAGPPDNRPGDQGPGTSYPDADSTYLPSRHAATPCLSGDLAAPSPAMAG